MSEDITIAGGIIITPFINAKKTLDEAMVCPQSQLERDGCIKRFEYTYELAWKTIKRVLQYKGIIANNPRDVFREAARQGIIDNPVTWFTFLDLRNETTHTYKEEVAEKVFGMIPAFQEEADKLLKQLLSLGAA